VNCGLIRNRYIYVIYVIYKAVYVLCLNNSVLNDKRESILDISSVFWLICFASYEQQLCQASGAQACLSRTVDGIFSTSVLF